MQWIYSAPPANPSLLAIMYPHRYLIARKRIASSSASASASASVSVSAPNNAHNRSTASPIVKIKIPHVFFSPGSSADAALPAHDGTQPEAHFHMPKAINAKHLQRKRSYGRFRFEQQEDMRAFADSIPLASSASEAESYSNVSTQMLRSSSREFFDPQNVGGFPPRPKHLLMFQGLEKMRGTNFALEDLNEDYDMKELPEKELRAFDGKKQLKKVETKGQLAIRRLSMELFDNLEMDLKHPSLFIDEVPQSYHFRSWH
ncbi:hypothetical protein O6H91_09G011200 [Diphasiastrum complanatum]|uniref:Uncharacterized protein n=1 Tax=Diphasiastrum complanatum TaxID=34168 RepID=A0ACC2CL89_DIPCM|nr:hypothetical protein O6H91_09G011200 [Diphasiastrum complanatum]